jgi:redox-sensing transcriptional repressor
MTNINRVTRFARYKTALRRYKEAGVTHVFSSDLGDAIGEKATQVRKDFSILSTYGVKKRGYDVNILLCELESLLGKHQMVNTIIVGYGRLARAIIDYKEFQEENINIIASFDNDESKIYRDSTVPVLPMEELSTFVKNYNIRIAIIAVPYKAAQKVFDQLLSSGVKGVLNFAPIHIKAPHGFPINNVNLAIEFDVVSGMLPANIISSTQ